MIDLIVLLGIAVIGAWGRYNLNLSAATATISRALAQGTVESGLRDIITPPLLTLGYYACFVAALAAYLGLSVFGDWSVLPVLLALLIGGVCAPSRFAPGADSPYWARLVHRSLRQRHTHYMRRGIGDRADAMIELAGRVERAFPDVALPAETAADT